MTTEAYLQGCEEKEDPFRIKGPCRRASETISTGHRFAAFGGGAAGCDRNLMMDVWVDRMIRGPYSHYRALFGRATPYNIVYNKYTTMEYVSSHTTSDLVAPNIGAGYQKASHKQTTVIYLYQTNLVM